MKRILALTYGMLAYAFFQATFVYAILFVGNVWVSKTIDSGPEAPLATTIAIDLAVLGIFAVQHSVMARKGFKRNLRLGADSLAVEADCTRGVGPEWQCRGACGPDIVLDRLGRSATKLVPGKSL
jgi:protein-S-isoprenylcysteine O-methyltransferase Ste14